MTVAEQTEMAAQLIHIVGQRLAHELVIGTDAVTVEKQSRLPPSLITWLKTLVRTTLLYSTTVITFMPLLPLGGGGGGSFAMDYRSSIFNVFVFHSWLLNFIITIFLKAIGQVG